MTPDRATGLAELSDADATQVAPLLTPLIGGPIGLLSTIVVPTGAASKFSRTTSEEVATRLGAPAAEKPTPVIPLRQPSSANGSFAPFQVSPRVLPPLATRGTRERTDAPMPMSVVLLEIRPKPNDTFGT